MSRRKTQLRKGDLVRVKQAFLNNPPDAWNNNNSFDCTMILLKSSLSTTSTSTRIGLVMLPSGEKCVIHLDYLCKI